MAVWQPERWCDDSNIGGSNSGVAAWTAVQRFEQWQFERWWLEQQCGSLDGSAVARTAAVRTAVWLLERQCGGRVDSSGDGDGDGSSGDDSSSFPLWQKHVRWPHVWTATRVEVELHGGVDVVRGEGAFGEQLVHVDE